MRADTNTNVSSFCFFVSAAKVAVEEKVATVKVEMREEIPTKGVTELNQCFCLLIKFKMCILLIFSISALFFWVI